MADPRLARPLWRGRTNVDAYTIAWIEHAEQIVRDEAPHIAHQFVITQGGYQGNGGDPDSGSTHALGGGTDMRYCGHNLCLLALRKAGGFVWHRKPLWRNGVLVWPDHFHGAPLGHPYMDPMLQRQETAYLNGRNGLADNGPDDGPRLNPIPRPVWPWPPEDDMPNYRDWPQADKNALAEDIVEAFMRYKPKGQDRAVEQLLKQAANAPGVVRDEHRKDRRDQ